MKYVIIALWLGVAQALAFQKIKCPGEIEEIADVH